MPRRLSSEDTGTLIALGIWAAGAVFSLAVTGFLLYAAYHFITKFW